MSDSMLTKFMIADNVYGIAEEVFVKTGTVEEMAVELEAIVDMKPRQLNGEKMEICVAGYFQEGGSVAASCSQDRNSMCQNGEKTCGLTGVCRKVDGKNRCQCEKDPFQPGSGFYAASLPPISSASQDSKVLGFSLTC